MFWKVQEAPTGRYRSFSRRSWPTGFSDKTQSMVVASISCEDEYISARVKTGEHKPLKVRLAIANKEEKREELGTWSWRTLKGEFKTLKEAKEAANSFYEKNKDLFIKG